MTPAKYAVLADTNVIVSASVRVTSAALRVAVTETNHEESKRLLDALLNRNGRGRCVVSTTVAREVDRVARRAATRVVNVAFGTQYGRKQRGGFLDADDTINDCVDKSHRLVSSMTRYDPPPSVVEQHLAEVDEMVEEIGRRYGDMAAGPAARIPRDARGMAADAAMPGGGRAAAEPGRIDAAQYKRFLGREPAGNTLDKRILAEAVSIRDTVGGSERMCIASNDMGIFAPLVLRGGQVSRPIVDMIRDRFAITCGSPRDIGALCAGP